MQSKFDSTIVLDQFTAAIALFCKRHDDDKREQHAMIAVETNINGRYSFHALDFVPDGPVNNNFYGNDTREGKDKVRLGKARVRHLPIGSENITKEELFKFLHLSEGTFFKDFRVERVGVTTANELLKNATKSEDSPPLFRYSGLQLEDDLLEVKDNVYNCTTWSRNQLMQVGLSLKGTLFAQLFESVGDVTEQNKGINIPQKHTTDTTITEITETRICSIL